MATSGTTILSTTRDDLINSALRKLGVLAEGVTANAQQLTDGAFALNTVVSSFQTLGMQLWSRTTYSMTPVVATSSYNIGVGQTINTPFPLKMIEAIFNVGTTGAIVPMDIKPAYDFNLLPTNSAGTPIALSYQPKINVGVISIWPTPDASMVAGSTISLTYQRPLEVYTAGTETADFPQEWANALIYNLALVLADEYSLPIQDKQWIEKQAEKHLNTALQQGAEEASLFFYPEKRG